MSSSIRSTVISCLVIIGLVLLVLLFSITRTPLLNEEQLRETGTFVLPQPRNLAPFSLVRHDGAIFSNEQFNGVWTFAFFGYTYCPDICPTTMSVLAKTQVLINESDNSNLKEGFQVVLFSVDPVRDTPEVLAPYVNAFSPAFLGATGTVPGMAQLAKQVSVGFQKVPTGTSSADGSYLVDHTSQIVLINPDGEYHGFVRAPHKAESLFQIYQTLQATF